MDNLIVKLKRLESIQINQLEEYIDFLLWKKSNFKQEKNSTLKILNSIPLAQKRIDKKLSNQLIQNFKDDWPEIKNNKMLTFWLIEQMKDIKNPIQSSYDAKRVYGDSRTGGFLEDKFGFLLKSFLISKNEVWTSNKSLILEINSPLKINGNSILKPDIKISIGAKKIPDVILELKSSWTKGTVKREIAKQKEKWNNISAEIKFLFIIFSASNKKSKTYSNAEDCRVICKDFTTDVEEIKKGVNPSPVNSIESIFEEIYEMLIKKI